jgi:hypothetical protein
MIPEESKDVLLLDIRKAAQPVGKLTHENVCNALVWNANSKG